MQNCVTLITGATDGVGKETAKALARKGFTVVMAARDGRKADAVKRDLVEATGNSAIDYLVADLASLTQVRRLAEAFKERYGRLDVLINNAGIISPTRVLTIDGFEKVFQVNYLSHFLLAQLLLDPLKKARQGRIVNLSSSVLTFGAFDAGNLQSEKTYSMVGAYAASKLLVLLFTVELSERLRGTRITANAVHPGVVKTPMLTGAPGILRVIGFLARPFALSPQQGAATSVYLASAAEVASISGGYFTASKATQIKSKYNTAQNRQLLWDLSVKYLQQALPA